MTDDDKLILGLLLQHMRTTLSLAVSLQSLEKTVCLLLPPEHDVLKRELLDEIARNESIQDTVAARLDETQRLLEPPE